MSDHDTCLSCIGEIPIGRALAADDLCSLCRQEDLYQCQICGELYETPQTNGDVDFCRECGSIEHIKMIWAS